MNKLQRVPWVALTATGYILCAFCRYAVWAGDEGYNCRHPLGESIFYSQASSGLEPLDDCWGFRPQKGLTLEGAREWIAANRGERDGE